MAEGTHREDNKHTIDPEKRKYMRFMQVGLSLWLAILPGMVLADMYGLYQILALVPVLLLMVGTIILAIGAIGWQELRDRRRAEKQGPPDCPKCP
jgi:hypothetical protein